MSALEDIKFDVERESWNAYTLSDGTTLRTKFVLIKVVRGNDSSGKLGYNFNSANHIASFTALKEKGTPDSKRYSKQELQSSVTEDLDFKTIKEEWNTYKLADKSQIDIKLILTRVGKTDKFDPMGSPVYLTQTQTVIKPKLAKELQKKVVKAMKVKGAKSKTSSYRV